MTILWITYDDDLLFDVMTFVMDDYSLDLPMILILVMTGYVDDDCSCLFYEENYIRLIGCGLGLN